LTNYDPIEVFTLKIQPSTEEFNSFSAPQAKLRLAQDLVLLESPLIS
jgi:hypothetical protein